MDFRIADTFTDSLARLAGEEQKAVKTTAFDLQLNPANPGMNLHKIEKSKDKNFWSVRAGSDIRIIVHKSDSNLLCCCRRQIDPAGRKSLTQPNTLQTPDRCGIAQLEGGSVKIGTLGQFGVGAITPMDRTTWTARVMWS